MFVGHRSGPIQVVGYERLSRKTWTREKVGSCQHINGTKNHILQLVFFALAH